MIVAAIVFALMSAFPGADEGEDGAEVQGGTDARIAEAGEDVIEVVGEFEERSLNNSDSGGQISFRGPLNGGTIGSSTVRAAESSEPACGPRDFVLGTYQTTVQDCRDPGGNWVLAELANDEGEEGEGAEQQDAAPREVIVVSREDVQSLLVNSGSLEVQPDQPWVLVNIDTIVMTDAAEHILSTQVLGLDVDVRVAPALFTWTFGDGSEPISGTDPGAPWPDHTVSHVYREAGTVTISLRTEWDAAFQVVGTSGWVPVTGRAVTVESSDSIEVVTATPRLTVD